MIRLLLLLILITVIGKAFWRVVDGIIEGLGGLADGGTGRAGAPGTGGAGRAGKAGGAGGDGRRGQIARSVQMARDPVCGTFVVPERSVTLLDGGSKIHFCSTACRDAYRTAHSQEARPA